MVSQKNLTCRRKTSYNVRYGSIPLTLHPVQDFITLSLLTKMEQFQVQSVGQKFEMFWRPLPKHLMVRPTIFRGIRTRSNGLQKMPVHGEFSAGPTQINCIPT